jgi:DNA polymerase phi
LNTHATVVRSGEKSIKIPAVASNGELWVSRVLTTIQALERDTKHVSLINNSNETEKALRTKALDVVARLKTVGGFHLRYGCDFDGCYRHRRNPQKA